VGLISDVDQQRLRETFAEMNHSVRLLFFTQTLGCDTCPQTRQILDELPPLSDKITIEEVNFVLEADKAAQYGIDRVPAVAVVGQVEVLLISALRRLWLYESAYGFTTVRLYAHAYMVVVALFLGMLGWGLARGLTSGWLARGAAGIAAVGMVALIYWNHEAWIVRQNVGRFLRTDQLDTSYLVWGLSPNAAPALVRSVPHLPPALADSVRGGLRQRYGQAAHGAPCRWFEWNRGRERAVAALRAGGIVRGDAQLHPRDCILILPASGPPA